MDFYFRNKVQNVTYVQMHPQYTLNTWQEKFEVASSEVLWAR